MKIVKGDISFNLLENNDPTSTLMRVQWDTWELDSFHIFNLYKNNEGIYMDIGAWVGPTAIYCANIYKKVIAIEPDPLALEELKKNISVNNINNISVIEKGLSSENGITQFGGNGKLGNSESTLLIANKEEYFSYQGRHTETWKHSHNEIVEIETITIEKLIEQQNIDPKNISLIKMDIEGGEKIVVPSLVNFLNTYKPIFYISLHPCFLKMDDINQIIDILFNIYDKCYSFSSEGAKELVDKNAVKRKGLICLVFE